MKPAGLGVTSLLSIQSSAGRRKAAHPLPSASRAPPRGLPPASLSIYSSSFAGCSQAGRELFLEIADPPLSRKQSWKVPVCPFW